MKDTGCIAINLILISVGFLSLIFAHSTPCILRTAPYGHVCVCNVTYCDYLAPLSPKGKGGFVLTSSSKEGLRFSRKTGKFSDKHIKVHDWMEPVHIFPSISEPIEDLTSNESTIKINRNKKHQKIIGFGGAFTTLVSHYLGHLKPELQDAVYKSYFSNNGLRYTLMRISIGGCDFDFYPWAYNEQPRDDQKLSNFTKLNKFDEKKIKQIKRLKSVSKFNNLRIIGTTWSPPRWMKTSNAWRGFSLLIPKYYQTYADYYLRFIQLMEASGIPIWGITTGNQPLDGTTFSSKVQILCLGWTPETQATWIADHLGPTIKNSKFKHVKILGNDDTVYTYPSWFVDMKAARNDSLQYLDAFASHWYWDSKYKRQGYDDVHKMFNKAVLNTESSIGGDPKLGSWALGEQYADTFIKDFHYSLAGFMDWNIVLNEKGGPSYANKTSNSAIVANVTSGEEIYKQPIFYAMGHFSRFIPENSVRIETNQKDTKIEAVAFQRPDGMISCVLINKENKTEVFNLVDSVQGTITMTIPPKSLHTIEYK